MVFIVPQKPFGKEDGQKRKKNRDRTSSSECKVITTDFVLITVAEVARRKKPTYEKAGQRCREGKALSASSICDPVGKVLKRGRRCLNERAKAHWIADVWRTMIELRMARSGVSQREKGMSEFP